jgi:hypothetical protein
MNTPRIASFAEDCICKVKKESNKVLLSVQDRGVFCKTFGSINRPYQQHVFGGDGRLEANAPEFASCIECEFSI